MPNSYFKFKQFTIHQERTAMKVGTDGVLLGAWTNIDSAQNILDIGAGTGLISIMLAQRSNARIDAIEIDDSAFSQALDNVRDCPWSDRIFLIHDSFQNYCKKKKTTYDLIVSNPPYFVNSLHAPDEQRTQARHNLSLSYEDILEGALELLKPDGRLALILPYIEGSIFIAEAASMGLFCNRKTNVLPNPGKKPKRLLLEFGKEKKALEETSLVIENHERHDYSEDYKNLTKDFYLKF